jgi:hypothetical protein
MVQAMGLHLDAGVALLLSLSRFSLSILSLPHPPPPPLCLSLTCVFPFAPSLSLSCVRAAPYDLPVTRKGDACELSHTRCMRVCKNAEDVLSSCYEQGQVI